MSPQIPHHHHPAPTHSLTLSMPLLCSAAWQRAKGQGDKEKAEKITGKPKTLPKGDRAVAEVIYRDGTVLDTIYNVPGAQLL